MENNLAVGARVKHSKYGEGIVYGSDIQFLKIFFREHGDKEISKEFTGLEILEAGPQVSNSLSIKDVELALRTVLQEFADFTPIIPLGEKWKGGTMILQPSNRDLQNKEIPLDTFFRKITMVRDRLRVLEQNINSHSKLDEEDKVNLQQYITRCYGSLTTFNILFARKEHQFVGEGKGD